MYFPSTGLPKITELYIDSYMGKRYSMYGHNVGSFVYSGLDCKAIIEDSMAPLFA